MGKPLPWRPPSEPRSPSLRDVMNDVIFINLEKLREYRSVPSKELLEWFRGKLLHAMPIANCQIDPRTVTLSETRRLLDTYQHLGDRPK